MIDNLIYKRKNGFSDIDEKKKERIFDFCEEYRLAITKAKTEREFCSMGIQLLEEAGFEVLFTCTEKVNRLTGDPAELLSLGRFNRPHGLSSWEMMEKFR